MPVLSDGAVDPSERPPACAYWMGTVEEVLERFPGAQVFGSQPAGFYRSLPPRPGCASGSPFFVGSNFRDGMEAPPKCDIRMAGDLWRGNVVGACIPEYRHECLEATYNRDAGAWTCTALGPRCGGAYPSCRPVPASGLFVYVDDPLSPTGLSRQPADAAGQPIWSARPEEVPAEASTGSNLMLYTGIGLAALLGLLALRR